jgi:uncharacterized protein (DUF2461 family)
MQQTSSDGAGALCLPDLMTILLRYLCNKMKLWSRVINNSAFSNYFGKLQGESLKRQPRGFDPCNPHIDDLKRKSFIATIRHIKPQSALTPVFIGEVEKAFTTAMPLMLFITGALEIRN